MASIIRYRTGWRALVRRAGISQSKTFKTKPEAQRWVREVEAEIDRGERVPVDRRITLDALIDRYLEFVRGSGARSRLGRSKEATLEILKRELSGVRLSEFDANVVLDLIERRKRAGAGSVTATHYIAYLKVALRHAGILLDAKTEAGRALLAVQEATTLLHHTGRLRSSSSRDRRPTDAELIALRDHLRAPSRGRRAAVPYWDLILFAIGTTLRLGEILNLRWEDFDPKTRTILVRDRKHPTQKEGNHGRIPLLQNRMIVAGEPIDTIAIIMRQPAAGKSGGLLFPYQQNSVSTQFGNLCKKLNIIDLNFHDLRHEAISRLFELGYEIQEVAVFSGHRSWDQLKRYTNLKPELLHRF